MKSTGSAAPSRSELISSMLLQYCNCALLSGTPLLYTVTPTLPAGKSAIENIQKLKHNILDCDFVIHSFFIFLLFCSPGALTHRIRSFHWTGFTLSVWFSPVNSTSASLPASSFFKRMNTSIELCQTDSTGKCSVINVRDALWKKRDGLLLRWVSHPARNSGRNDHNAGSDTVCFGWLHLFCLLLWSWWFTCQRVYICCWGWHTYKR